MGTLNLGLPSYIGRGILSGLTTNGVPADIYFAEGRSPPSRMRKLFPYEKEGRVHMDLNSETSLKEMIEKGGNPDLLLYDAMVCNDKGLIVVSNGFQTNCDPIWKGAGREEGNLKGVKENGGIYNKIIRYPYADGVEMALRSSLKDSGSEVDSLRTARIASARYVDKTPELANIGIVIRPRDHTGKGFLKDDVVRVDTDIPLKKGEFIVFGTYGVDNPPYYAALPPNLSTFEGYTRRVHLDSTKPEDLVEEVFEGLPKDILVGVSVAMRSRNQYCGFRFAKNNMKE